MTTPSCVYVDMDGVLVDLVGGVLDMWGVPASSAAEVTHMADLARVVSQGNPWGTQITPDTLWATVAAAGEGWWATLRPTPWLAQLVDTLETSGIPWMVLTTSMDPGCSAGKHRWCAQWLPRGTRVALTAVTQESLPTGCKHHLAHPGALLVDDDPGNLARFRAHGGSTLLWPAPWNGCTDPQGYLGALEQLDRMLGSGHG